MNIMVAQQAVDGIASFVNQMRSIGYDYRSIVAYKNSMFQYLMTNLGNITNAKPGICFYQIPNTSYNWAFSYTVNPKNQVVVITGMGLKNAVNESKKTNVVSRQQISKVANFNHKMIVENILTPPGAKPFKLGEYDCIDGAKWESIQYGLEGKGSVYGLCFYVKDDTGIALFQRCDNQKYFYAKIEKETENKSKWVPLKRESVPKIILSDFRQCLSRLEERMVQAILATL